MAVSSLLQELLILAGSAKDLERLTRRSRATIARYLAVNRTSVKDRAVPSREDALRLGIVHAFLAGETEVQEQLERAKTWLAACGYQPLAESVLKTELRRLRKFVPLPAAEETLPREVVYLCEEPLESLIEPGASPGLERFSRMQMMRACELTQLIGREDLVEFKRRASGGISVFVPRFDKSEELAKLLDPAHTPASLEGIQKWLSRDKDDPRIAPQLACWILIVISGDESSADLEPVESAVKAMRNKLPSDIARRIRLFSMVKRAYVHMTDWWFYVPANTDDARPFGHQVLVDRRLLKLIEREKDNPGLESIVKNSWAFSCLLTRVDDDLIGPVAELFGLDDAVTDHQHWDGKPPAIWTERCPVEPGANMIRRSVSAGRGRSTI